MRKKKTSLTDICTWLYDKDEITISTQGLSAWMLRHGLRKKADRKGGVPAITREAEQIKKWFHEGLTDGEIARNINRKHGTVYKSKQILEWREYNGVTESWNEAFLIAYTKQWITAKSNTANGHDTAEDIVARTIGAL